MNKQNWH